VTGGSGQVSEVLVPVVSPAGVRLRWLLDALSGRVPLEAGTAGPHLDPSFQRTVPAGQLVASLLDVAADLGALTVERVDEVSPYEMAARVVGGDLRLWVVRVSVSSAPPHGIVSATVSPARVPTEAGCSVPVPWSDMDAAQPVVHATLTEPLLGEADRLLLSARDALRQPALLAAVTVGGRPALSWAGGVAELSTGRRAGRRQALRAAGLSRTVTALTVLSLAAEGVVALDDPAERHLRAVRLASAGEPATVADLLRHTTGLLPQPATVTGVRTGSHVPTPADLYAPALVADQPRGAVAPADENTVLAGLLVEDVTGATLADEAARRVLDPLGMRHSSLRLDERVARQPVCGYDVDFDEVAVTSGTEVVLQAAYGLVSTLDDLSLLGAALATPGGLDDVCEGLTLVDAPVPTGEDGLGSGLGVFTAGLLDGRTAVWQSGGWPGAIVALWALPGTGVSAVLAGNAFTPRRLHAVGQLAADLMLLGVEASSGTLVEAGR
jgi:D-alanyl-D-alanine carboxypeptidase